MTLDKSKKYVFAGKAYEWDSTASWWYEPTVTICWDKKQFKYFADNGLVTEAREPMTIEVIGVLGKDADFIVDCRSQWKAIHCGRTFRGTLTEVISE